MQEHNLTVLPQLDKKVLCTFLSFHGCAFPLSAQDPLPGVYQALGSSLAPPTQMPYLPRPAFGNTSHQCHR